MVQVAKGVFGVVAVSLTVGAVQFASGPDFSANARDRLQYSQDVLKSPLQNALAEVPVATGAAVNRAAKSDRVAAVAGSSAQMLTIALRLDGFSSTSFLFRVPVANGGWPVTKPGDRKMTVACEPVVSVRTEIANRLEPGRCVT